MHLKNVAFSFAHDKTQSLFHQTNNNTNDVPISCTLSWSFLSVPQPDNVFPNYPSTMKKYLFLLSSPGLPSCSNKQNEHARDFTYTHPRSQWTNVAPTRGDEISLLSYTHETSPKSSPLRDTDISSAQSSHISISSLSSGRLVRVTSKETAFQPVQYTYVPCLSSSSSSFIFFFLLLLFHGVPRIGSPFLFVPVCFDDFLADRGQR